MGILDWLRGRTGQKVQEIAVTSAATRSYPAPAIDWRMSEGHQRLLGHFQFPNSIRRSTQWDHWDTLLPEPAAAAVERLVSERALVPATDARELIQYGKSAADLKRLCKERGLKVSGSKEDLAQRLLQIDPELKSLGPNETLYVCSPEAAVIARARREAWEATQLDDPVLRGDFTRGDFDAALRELAQRFEREGRNAPSDDDAKWHLLTQAVIEHSRNGAMGLCRNTYYTQSRFLARRGQHRHALEILCRVCALDLNGSSNGPKPFDQSDIMLAPRVVAELQDMAEEAGVAGDALRALYIKVAGQIQMPLAPERTWPILEAALSGEIDLNNQPKCFREIQRRLAT